MKYSDNDLLNKINSVIEKHDLEGHEDVLGGMRWFAGKTTSKDCNCIQDFYDNDVYNFSTPRYSDNGREICAIMLWNGRKIESLIKDLES